MKVRIWRWIWLAAVWAYGQNVVSPDELTEGKLRTLDDCIRYAQTHNSEIRRALLRAHAKDISFAQSRYELLPSLRAGSSGMWNYGLTQNLTTGILENQTVFGNNVRVESSMPLFQGLSLRYNREAAFWDKIAEYSRYVTVSKRITADVVKAYLQILMDREAARVAKTQWLSTVAQVKKMRELTRAGTRSVSDLKDMEAQAAANYLEYVRIGNKIKTDLWQLASLLQLRDTSRLEVTGEAFRIDESLLWVSPDSLIARHKENIAEFYLWEASEKSARYRHKASKGALYPVVSLFLSWNSRYMDREKITGVELDPSQPYRIIGFTEHSHENVLAPNFRYVTGPPDPYWEQIRQNQGTAIGFMLTIPIFDKFRNRTRIRQARLQWEETRLANAEEFNRFRHQVIQFHTAALNEKARMEAARANREAARTAYRFAEEKLEAGLITTYELETVRTRKMKAEADYLNAKYSYWLNLKLLEILLGAASSTGMSSSSIPGR